MKSKERIPAWILMLTAAAVLVGCSAALFRDYGTILPSSDITGTFERYEFDRDLNYYFSGPEVYPNAILGLKKTFALEAGLWKPVDPEPEVMRRFVSDMQSRALLNNEFLHGFVIRDPEGRPIGIWYSILSARTSVRVKADGTVAIPPPPIRDDDRRWRMGNIPSSR
ncbi:MAG: hypothetical protein JW950_09430 [Deltaproteobacteria bacterium]|nr:hypothetical protein [Deltaproteobacteria bacterium]